MPFLPPVPSWDSAHVLIVHLPIGLLLLSPILVVLGMLPGRWRDGLRIGALLVLALGTTGAFVAAEAGEAAAELVQRTEQITATLERHQDFATVTCWVFLGATIAYALFVIGAMASAKVRGGIIAIVAQVVVILAIAVGCLYLADTGHLGGRLVHEFGVHAMM